MNDTVNSPSELSNVAGNEGYQPIKKDKTNSPEKGYQPTSPSSTPKPPASE